MTVNDDNILVLGKYIIGKCIDDEKYINNLQTNLIITNILHVLRPDLYGKLRVYRRPLGNFFCSIYDKYCAAGAFPLTYKPLYILTDEEINSLNIMPEEKEIMDKIIEGLKEEIDTFSTEIDSSLSVSNALTTVTFEY